MLDLPALARGDAVLMQHTKLQNTFTCQPQQRNMHGRVFGGFLMRWSSHAMSKLCSHLYMTLVFAQPGIACMHV